VSALSDARSRIDARLAEVARTIAAGYCARQKLEANAARLLRIR